MMKPGESKQNLIQNSTENVSTISSVAGTSINLNDPTEKPLGPIEKTFLLHAERGDCATVRRLIKEYADHPEELDINCVDPLNRSALIAAIENENIELIKLLLEENIKVKDGLLHAIKEEYVEAVEMLLHYEEEHHIPGEPYTWEAVDRSSATFTSDITPLILAAHKNNYEIIKILLDRGATLPMPHDVRCGCDECVESSSVDSLRHSQARINAYRALTASSLIALSSKDPLLTAFELSWELRRLSRMETEFRADYNEMRSLVQTFATSLLDHARTSYELEIMLNYDTEGDTWEPGEHQTLERLKLAIKYKQKVFVAHPSVQQLLAAIWYEGLPGFRRKSLMGQMVQVAQMGAMFPVYCTIYMISPQSKMGLFMKKPFVKFICHSTSYAFFLMLLGAASQRVEILALQWFGNEWIQDMVKEWHRKERGAAPGIAECGVILYMISLIWGEIRSLWDDGLLEYISDLWNVVDFITNVFYVMWLACRMSAYYIVWFRSEVEYKYFRNRCPREGSKPRKRPVVPPRAVAPVRPHAAFRRGLRSWNDLQLVHIFSVNPHLGPLQISLGRMIIDIVKFFFIYTLVLFAFGCGLNQLLWYYAELEKSKCYHLASGLPDFDNNDKACSIWRRYANLFETSQSLFWASFGLVDLVSFELTGIKGFTRFWALLMFGSYSVINVIVLLNMLIAMMSNSYQIISERSDSEWKFARSKLWISYFDDGDTLPPPFNLFPTPKNLLGPLGCIKKERNTHSFKRKTRENARERHETIMRLLVRRYVTAEQRKRDDFGITEDDVMEIRQDISTLRYELIDILRQNGMKTPSVSSADSQLSGKKGKVMERRLLKDFHIGIVEAAVTEAVQSKEPKDIFGHLAKVIGKRSSNKSKKKDWNALVRKNTIIKDHIGTAQEAENARNYRQSLRRHILANVEKPVEIDQDKLLEYNPLLSEVPKGARVAYAKFMTRKIQQDYSEEDETDKKTPRKSIKGMAPPKPSVKFKGPVVESNGEKADGDDKKADGDVKEMKMAALGDKIRASVKIPDTAKVMEKSNTNEDDSKNRPKPETKQEKTSSETKLSDKSADKKESAAETKTITEDSKTSDRNDCKPTSKADTSDLKNDDKSDKNDNKPDDTFKEKDDDNKTETKQTDGVSNENKPTDKASTDGDSKVEASSKKVTITVEPEEESHPSGKSKLSGHVRTGWI